MVEIFYTSAGAALGGTGTLPCGQEQFMAKCPRDRSRGAKGAIKSIAARRPAVELPRGGRKQLQYQESCCLAVTHRHTQATIPLHAKHERKNLILLPANIGHTV
jgi:hypothetical protein